MDGMATETRDSPPPGLIELSVLAEAAECLRTLAHPIRLRMVQMLLGGRYTVGELAAACGIASPMASGHLRLLERCGLLRHERQRREVFYRATQPCLQGIIACIQKSFAHRPIPGPDAAPAPGADNDRNSETRNPEP
jgi:ArsR family transcriptional regulator, zinc-responsive transcriptional repressor